MIDIETLDTAPSAAILQIGAQAFTEQGIAHQDIFFRGLMWEPQLVDGRTQSPETIAFWNGQPHREKVKSGMRKIGAALFDLGSFIGPDDCVWSRGPLFDMAILEHACRMYDAPIPWNFRNVRCVRTLEALAGHLVEKPKRKGQEHDALHDAQYQAEYAARMLKALKK